MFFTDKKKIQTVLKSRAVGSTVESKSEENLGVKDDAFTALAEEILSAVQEKSALRLAECLRKISNKDYKKDQNGE